MKRDDAAGAGDEKQEREPSEIVESESEPPRESKPNNSLKMKKLVPKLKL